jgi:hypothetical protein|uniref:Major capsid protein n=1 Tax=Siphoviridae sp. ctLsx2 TaxID=2826254 RepID=A0A8S5QTW1_9CAUD|nr:MAG TPA: Major capsid protein [Siphoviridae sp. ctLsx2]
MSEPNPNPNPTPAPSPEPSPAKTFTQEEVDAMIGKRLAKAMKGMPSDDELTAYRTWKDSQQTEQERQAKREKEFADNKSALTAAQAEVQQLKREKYVLSKGLTGEEAEFISFKAEKIMDDKTTFEQAVDKLTENRQKVKFDWTAPAGGGSEKNNVNAAMNSLIRGALK